MALILVVDDEENVLDSLCRLVRGEGRQVHGVATAEEAVQFARVLPLDVALLDLKIGNSNGIQLFEMIRTENPRVSGVLLSGFLTVKIAIDAIHLGFTDVLEKPVSKDLLLRAINRAIGDSASRRVNPANLGATPMPTRLARAIVSVSDEGADFRTISEWGHRIGVSGSTIRGWCHTVGVKPKHALDLARALRAHRLAIRFHASDRDLLDFSDKRTLDRFLGRGNAATAVSLEEFCTTQKYVTSAVVVEAVIRLVRTIPTC
jgi:ActR/RegA family two-component response regulator